MKLQASWKIEYKNEIENAIRARLNGNEGMARVCARRAAGIVIGEYLNRHGFSTLTHRFFERLSLFVNLPDLDQKYKDIANRFLIKVNLDHTLPSNVDLISDVIWLEKSLLSESND